MSQVAALHVPIVGTAETERTEETFWPCLYESVGQLTFSECVGDLEELETNVDLNYNYNLSEICADHSSCDAVSNYVDYTENTPLSQSHSPSITWPTTPLYTCSTGSIFSPSASRFSLPGNPDLTVPELQNSPMQDHKNASDQPETHFGLEETPVSETDLLNRAVSVDFEGSTSVSNSWQGCVSGYALRSRAQPDRSAQRRIGVTGSTQRQKIKREPAAADRRSNRLRGAGAKNSIWNSNNELKRKRAARIPFSREERRFLYSKWKIKQNRQRKAALQRWLNGQTETYCNYPERRRTAFVRPRGERGRFTKAATSIPPALKTCF